MTDDLLQSVATDVRDMRRDIVTLSVRMAEGFASGNSHFKQIDDKLKAMPSCQTCDPSKAILAMRDNNRFTEGVHRGQRVEDNKANKANRTRWGWVTMAAIVFAFLVNTTLAIAALLTKCPPSPCGK